LKEIAPKGVKRERDDAGRRYPLLSDLITNSSLITRKEFAGSIHETSISQWIKKEGLLSNAILYFSLPQILVMCPERFTSHFRHLRLAYKSAYDTL
jgi:hypothetical protein